MHKPRTTNQIATERYATSALDIARLLNVLEMELDRHEEESNADPKNWGRVADLDIVRHNLIDIIAFISSAKMDRKDVKRFLAEAE